MCLAIPGRIISIADGEARVAYGSVTTSASLRTAPDAKVGDTVLVHAGFVISVLDEKEAEEMRNCFLTAEEP